MALIIEIKANEDIVEKYACERVEEFEGEDKTYTYKAWKLIPESYEAFTGKVARWKMNEKEPPKILRHKYLDGAGFLAIKMLKVLNKK